MQRGHCELCDARAVARFPVGSVVYAREAGSLNGQSGEVVRFLPGAWREYGVRLHGTDYVLWFAAHEVQDARVAETA